MPKKLFTKEDKHLMAKGGRNKRLPPDLKAARKARRVDVEIALEQFVSMSWDELKEYDKRPEATMFEKMVISVIKGAVQGGDQSKLSFILDNWVGPITKRVEVEANLSHHASIVQQIEDEE
jgi:hypothetical protein